MEKEKESSSVTTQNVEQKGKAKYYVPGYKYLVASTFLKDWEYTIQSHKNNNGKHFDLRLYCPGSKTPVFSWSAKKPFWDREQATLMRRSKDHNIKWLTFSGEYVGRNGITNKMQIIETGTAQLIDFSKKELLFRTKTSIFKLLNIRGVRYLYIPARKK